MNLFLFLFLYCSWNITDRENRNRKKQKHIGNIETETETRSIGSLICGLCSVFVVRSLSFELKLYFDVSGLQYMYHCLFCALFARLPFLSVFHSRAPLIYDNICKNKFFPNNKRAGPEHLGKGGPAGHLVKSWRTVKKCGKCLAVFYYSRECQRAHWYEDAGHKVICKEKIEDG